MFFKKVKNLLPKKLADGVAPKTPVFEQWFSRSRGFRKPTILAKLLPLSLIAVYLLGYQPTLAIPPIKRSIATAQAPEVKIDFDNLGKQFDLPHLGYISTRYLSWHPGIDIATGLGMPIHPIAEGEITEVNFGFWGLGNHVTIDHGQEIKSLYAHMGRVYVKKGDKVTRSSTIGTVGLTGRTSGPHTHLEITKNDQSINPENILPTLPNFPIAQATQSKNLPTKNNH